MRTCRRERALDGLGACAAPCINYGGPFTRRRTTRSFTLLAPSRALLGRTSRTRRRRERRAAPHPSPEREGHSISMPPLAARDAPPSTPCQPFLTASKARGRPCVKRAGSRIPALFARSRSLTHFRHHRRRIAPPGLGTPGTCGLSSSSTTSSTKSVSSSTRTFL